MPVSSRFLVVLSLLIAFSTKAGYCFLEISLHECPCSGYDCKRNPSPEWTTFTYEDSGDTLRNVTVRLIPAHDRKCDSVPSQHIHVNVEEPQNVAGFHGVLLGSVGNESVEFEIVEDGTLTLFASNTRREEQFSRESYCVQRVNSSESILKICCGSQPHKNACLRKCCPYGYSFTNDVNNPCVESRSSKSMWNIPVPASISGERNLKIRTGMPDCAATEHNLPVVYSTSLTKFNITRRPFRLNEDGTVKFLGGGGSTWKTKLDDVDYCVDQLRVPDDHIDMTCGEDEQDVLILCQKPHVKKAATNDWIYRVVYMVGFVIAIIALLATAIVHFLLWEKQNSHGWTIFCYVVTLTLFYACLLVIYVDETRKRMPDSHESYFSKQVCFALGVITHFMGIFSFAWLCVINFDLWWTFRVLKPMNQRALDMKRLLCYGSFAVAVPITVVSIAYAFQLSYEKRGEPCRKTNTIYPKYGEDGCFLANSSQPYYFYIPVGILLLANLIFYLCTSCQMLKIYNATRRISSERSSGKQKQSCELFLKLFLVMGTTWIFQVILSIVQTDETTSYSPLFAVLDMVNVFQAIAIFVIFACKRETLRALLQKYTCLKACLHPLREIHRTPTVLSRSTDGSTKMSRTEYTKSHIETDHRRDSELISFS